MDQDLTLTGLFGLMEAAINHALQLDPATLKRLGKLSGQVIEVDCSTPAFRIFLRPHAQGLILQSHFEHDADCRISGNALALLRLMTADNKSEALFDQQISLSGDIELSQSLQAILADLDLDWEGRLAEYIGDIAAHQIGNQVRNLKNWGQQASHSMLQNIEEYLHEETRTLPPRAELEPFYRDVEALALDTDRLAARIERLQNTQKDKAK
ncbi:MAG: SCP2 sterol-binding domain-containing protein [Pseudomonadales bacterium]|jgi:ubiquinone biosynthesis protein UbiJ